MNKKEDLKLAWKYITLIETSRNNDKLINLNGTEFKVLAYIAWRNGKAYINEIQNHPAFKYFSLSTIKRAIVTLLNNDLIEQRTYDKDNRINTLHLKENTNE